MKCPRCGATSDVAETRPGAHHTTRRRRECHNGHRFTTVEIHGPAFSNVAPRVAQYAQAMSNRITRWMRDMRIAKDPRPSRQVAQELGVNDSRVRQIRRAFQTNRS